MDIQVYKAEIYSRDPEYTVIWRSLDTIYPLAQKCPKDLLALRAAEYNLDIEDPRAFDMVMMEMWVSTPEEEVIHPLYRCEYIEESLEIVMSRVDEAKKTHGHPEDKWSLFHAADLPEPESTKGLTDSKEIFLTRADKDVMRWQKIMRDEGRKRILNETKSSLAQRLKAEAFTVLQGHAMMENEERKRNANLRGSSRN